MNILSAVAIVTILAPVSFCQKTKYPHLQPPKWNRQEGHIVFTSIIRLGGVDGFCSKTKLGISVFINTAPAAKRVSWKQH